MKRNILLACLVFIFVGCEANKQQPEPQEAKKEIIVEEVKPVIAEEKIEKPKKRVLKGTYYRMLTKSIEVFAYKGKLYGVSEIDEKKLRNPFYIKGNLIRIEKVYTSTIGEQYGKISGKNLLVSMDDLTTYIKK